MTLGCGDLHPHGCLPQQAASPCSRESSRKYSGAAHRCQVLSSGQVFCYVLVKVLLVMQEMGCSWGVG